MIKGWEEKEINDLLSYEQPWKYFASQINNKAKTGVPVLTANKGFVLGYSTDINFCTDIPTILFDDFTTDTKYVDFPFLVRSSAIKILRAKNNNNLYFLYNLFKITPFIYSGHKRYYLSEYRYQKLNIPSIEEQNYIAKALYDTNELIEQLEKLIVKKKQIKIGIMQQLLTGKKRLPGFTEPWNKTIITELINRFATGLNPRQNFILNKGGNCKYVTIKDFSNNKISFKSCDTITKQDMLTINKRSDLRENDILFSSIGRIGDIYLIKEDPTNWNINESVFSLRPNIDVVNPKYLTYSFLSDIFKNEMTKLISGSTLSSIKMNQLKELSIDIPTDFKEQAAIANILSDIDKDIELLENKLIKYQQIKTGMMQQLLTGKIRLLDKVKIKEKETDKNQNQTFNDAVIFASIVAACYHPDYHLGRKKAQKLLYMFKRFDNQSVEQFGHYAAGPYDKTARYGGFESLAIKNKYIIEQKNPNGKGCHFIPGEEIEKAKEYWVKYGYDKFTSIIEQLKYFHVDVLELYTTVDKAILELKEQKKEVSFNSVKASIAKDAVWVNKLAKDVFSDNNIQLAI